MKISARNVLEGTVVKVTKGATTAYTSSQADWPRRPPMLRAACKPMSSRKKANMPLNKSTEKGFITASPAAPVARGRR